ncbi:hypothetical protein ACXYMU_09535 [Pontibacter sp. CAU 1760]
MRKLYLYSLALLAALLSLTSCDDEEGCELDLRTVEATLHWTGDYAIDGCGYILKIGDVDHKPENEDDIPDSYKTYPPTAVEAKIIDYNTTVRTCQAGEEMKSIKVVELRRL